MPDEGGKVAESDDEDECRRRSGAYPPYLQQTGSPQGYKDRVVCFMRCHVVLVLVVDYFSDFRLTLFLRIHALTHVNISIDNGAVPLFL